MPANARIHEQRQQPDRDDKCDDDAIELEVERQVAREVVPPDRNEQHHSEDEPDETVPAEQRTVRGRDNRNQGDDRTEDSGAATADDGSREYPERAEHQERGWIPPRSDDCAHVLALGSGADDAVLDGLRGRQRSYRRYPRPGVLEDEGQPDRRTENCEEDDNRKRFL